MQALTKIERETIILFNEAEPTAHVYTCNRAMQTRLDGLCAQNAKICRLKADDVSKTYLFPKKWLKVKKPRVYTSEIRQKHVLQLQRANQMQKGGDLA